MTKEVGSEEKAKAQAKKAAKKRLEKAAAQFADMKAPQLRAELEDRKLSSKGKKAELMDRLAAAAEKEHRKFEKKHFEKAMSAFEDMKDKDLKIFDERMTAHDPLTLQQLGKQFGVSRERVRQLEARLRFTSAEGKGAGEVQNNRLKEPRPSVSELVIPRSQQMVQTVSQHSLTKQCPT